MADRVDYTKLFSEARNNVVALITSTNVADPTISSAEFRKWIYSREPDVKSSDFKGYPFLIVHPSNVDVGEGGSLDGKKKMIYWDIEIEVVTSDRGYGSNDAQGLSHIGSISNDLIKTFLDMTNRTTLSNNSMKFVRPVTTPVITSGIANELVYRRSMMLSFKTRMAVSA